MLYTNPQAIQQTTMQLNQKQIQQHIPTHTTEKHQLFRQENNNSLPWPPIRLSQSWMPQQAEKFLGIPWRSTQGGLSDWGGTELQCYGALGKKPCQQFHLFSALRATVCLSHSNCSNIKRGKGRSLVWEAPKWHKTVNASTGARNYKTQPKRQCFCVTCWATRSH